MQYSTNRDVHRPALIIVGPASAGRFLTRGECGRLSQFLAVFAILIGFEISSAEERIFDGLKEGANRLVIYGGTPGGVALAVRAAREGVGVLLVSHSQHLGGMLSSGLSTMDTLYNGARAPLYDELRQSISAYYRDRYGADSPQFAATQPGRPKTRYEAHVVEKLIEDLLEAESGITIVRGYIPVAVTQDSSMLRTVTFRQLDGGRSLTISADVFADCSYEADLAAVANVPYRVGREARSDFQEKHAGVVYMRHVPWPPEPKDAAAFQLARRLNLYRYESWYELMEVPGAGEAHPSVQGYNMRTIITDDPDNRVPIDKPANYNPEDYRKFGFGNPDRPGLTMPNRKFGLNSPKLIGQQDPYVEGDWQTRREVTRKHVAASLGLMYFRQHAPSVPAEIREKWKSYGLPKDEFADNGHVPYEVYARETRRIVGRAVFTENDAQLAADLERAPVHPSSISITEWFLDSHGCTPRTAPGSESEGKVMLKNQTFPGQVPYETLLPQNLDNLLVPVCLSASHVGWGTIRLEPTWMSIAEAAGFAVAMAKDRGTTPAEIDVDQLVRRLADERVMISFFNDVEEHVSADWYPAVQYLGTQGYFGSYDARPLDVLTAPLAEAWTEHFANRQTGKIEPPTIAAGRVLAAEKKSGEPVTAGRFAAQLSEAARAVGLADYSPDSELERLDIPANEPITRADACRLLYAAEGLKDQHP